jgi:hypothetical protein
LTLRGTLVDLAAGREGGNKRRMKAMNAETHTPTLEVQKHHANLEAAFAAFQAEHPDVVAAMAVMNVSFIEYLDAMSALEGAVSTVSTSV